MEHWGLLCGYLVSSPPGGRHPSPSAQRYVLPVGFPSLPDQALKSRQLLSSKNKTKNSHKTRKTPSHK